MSLILWSFLMQDPILDTSVLDDLRDCLSEDLWSSPDMQPLPGDFQHPSRFI